jgi:hypothetical protein
MAGVLMRVKAVRLKGLTKPGTKYEPVWSQEVDGCQIWYDGALVLICPKGEDAIGVPLGQVEWLTCDAPTIVTKPKEEPEVSPKPHVNRRAAEPSGSR